MDSARPALPLDGPCNFTLIIGSSDHREFGTVKGLYGFDLLNHNGDLILTESDQPKLSEGDHTKATLRCVCDVLKHLPDGSKVQVITKLDYLANELNRPTLLRKSTNYQHSKGGGLLADYEQLMQMDDMLCEKNVSISAKRPGSVAELARYDEAKSRAKDLLNKLLSAGLVP